MALVRNVTLEMSIKPFRSNDKVDMESVCRELFGQWRALLSEAEVVSVLLWTSDGSELLDYKGSLDDTFEWAKWQGVANPCYEKPAPDDPWGDSVHCNPRLYMENPPERTYAWLRDLVCMLKKIGTEVTGLPVRVGTTFDPGPEFAVSDFKYKRHKEICLAKTMGNQSFLCCYGDLKSDDFPYAGFPDGIKEGTIFGTFLGRQSEIFCKDIGFDYLWLSNGFGFGLDTWGMYGAVFDGEKFSGDCCEEVRDKIFLFWKTFREECPNLPIETRGTNLTTGMDLSSDAVPLREIYNAGLGIEPPPNSPWAALDGNFGLEMIGWMSHIAEVPDDSYPFRFYTHDPWFLNSPWLDRYYREPHDIFLPMAVGRLNADGEIRKPTNVQFLTADDSWGRMPRTVPNEVIPHILNCLETGPDMAGPLLWVYPFAEYHDRTYEGKRIDEVFFGDWFMQGAFNEGLPLNTVVSSDNFVKIAKSDEKVVGSSIIVLPVPDADSELSATVKSLIKQGGKVLLYGPTGNADAELLELLGIKNAEAVDGEFDLKLDLDTDLGRDVAMKIRHDAFICGGGLKAVRTDEKDDSVKTLASTVAGSGSESRVLAVSSASPEWNGGRAVWVRGTNSFRLVEGARLPAGLSEEEYFRSERLIRMALSEFGISILAERRTADLGGGTRPGKNGPMLTISRNRNAFYFAGHSPDTSARLHMSFPFGVPVFMNEENVIENGLNVCQRPAAWRRECRVFVEQEDGIVQSREQLCGHPKAKIRRIRAFNLKNATVRFFYDPEFEDQLFVEQTKNPADFIRVTPLQYEKEETVFGPCVRLDGVSGEVMFSW